MHLRRQTLIVLAASLLCGCAADPFRAAPNVAYRTSVELRDTPFFPQEKYQCGPAALATLLVRSGVDVHPDQLVAKVYIPERRGSLQPEMLAASRDYGRLPYVIQPSFAALLAEVEDGRPVLVLQNLGVSLLPAWHYAVVVGFSPEAGEMILRSGTDKRRVTAAGAFARTWRRSDNWGLVLLRPGELPANPDRRRFLNAAAAAESAGRFDLAAPAYAAASVRWPDSGLAWLGRGNAAYGRGDLAQAERWYRRALEIDPADPATLNNLATVVAEQGRCDAAAAIIGTAMELPGLTATMSAALAGSQADITACESGMPRADE